MKITRQSTVINPLISIVTGTYNRFELLKGLFASTRENIPVGVPCEFVINDNGSTDGTLEWLRDLPGNDLTLIESGELVGGLRAFTDAGRAARGKYVILANDDVAFVGKDSILAAMVHLENTPTCGAVAFYDDRPIDKGERRFHVLTQPAILPDGRPTSIVYAQVGMYRKWLGDLAGWWGADDLEFKSRTYGGDNYLTCQIVERGYTVDPVEATRVHDYMIADELRKITGGAPEGNQQHPDTAAYLKRYPRGPQIAPKPTVENPDKRQLRVLYVPILDGGTARQFKHGLRDALAKFFITAEYDYIGANHAAPHLRPRERQAKVLEDLTALVRVFQPDLMLAQIHDVETFTPQTLSALRTQVPQMVVVNWNGDYWTKGLTIAPMLSLLRNVDLQLVVNASVLEIYQQHGIPAAYWQCAYEDSPTPYEGDVPGHDVVFMGNAYSEERKILGNVLRSFNSGINVGIYGNKWGFEVDGKTTYHFPLGEAIYKASKIAIGDNQYASDTDGYGFVSNRIFQVLGAGGAMLLHQTVPGLEQLTGIKEGVHYIGWTDVVDMAQKIHFWLDDKQAAKRKKIATAAAKFIRQSHSFDARVRELVKLLPMARRVPDGYVVLEFTGAREQFGVVGPITTRQYVYTPSKMFIVDKQDARVLMQRSSHWIEKSVTADPVGGLEKA